MTLERNCRTRTNAITHNCLVTLDQKLTFVRQINLLCGSCYYQLRQLRVVSLSPAAASTLVHAFVISRLDYCSEIYERLPTCRLKCLDRVLRTSARLLGRMGTLLLHCYYSVSYLIALFIPGGVAGPPNADCYPTAPSLLCGWSDGLEWSTGCAAFDASSPLSSFSLLS